MQDNFKRLLAYSSIEHMGIISLGVGIGGPIGLYGALLHMLNHALAKPLMFFASGKIQSRFGSTNIANVTRRAFLHAAPRHAHVHRRLGAVGHAAVQYFPLSEFTVMKAAVDRGLWPVVALFLFFVVIVFYGVLSGFGKMLFGKQEVQFPEVSPRTMHRVFYFRRDSLEQPR